MISGTIVSIAVWLGLLDGVLCGRGNRRFRGRKTQSVALGPILAGDERVFIGDDVAKPHALVPGEAAGIRDVAAERDRIGEAWRDRKHAQHIAIADGGRETGWIEAEFDTFKDAALADPLERGTLAVGNGGEAARQTRTGRRRACRR